MPFILRKTITETFLARMQACAQTKSKDRSGDRSFLFKNSHAQWEEVSFSDFYEQTRLISYGLIELGIQPQEKVAILSRSRIEWQVLDMAIMGAKAVTVPISSSLTAVDTQSLLKHSEAKYVVVEDTLLLEKIISLKDGKKIIVIESSSISANSRELAALPEVLTLQALKELGKRAEGKRPTLFQENLTTTLPTDVFTLCYTTGTSGDPKCVPLTHQNLMSVVEDCLQRMNKRIRSEREVVLTVLPFSHVMGRLQSLIMYTIGGTLAFSRQPDHLLEDLKKIQPTLIFSVPKIFETAFVQVQTQLETKSKTSKKVFDWAKNIGHQYQSYFLKNKNPPVKLITQYALAKRIAFQPIAAMFGGKLRFAICGGARLNQDLGEFFEMAGIRILEGYGLTETCSAVTLNDPDRPRFGSVGRPLSEVMVKIAEDGEILIQSKKMFQGYWKDSIETRRVLKKGWFHTGDIGQLDPDGYLFVTDRKKDMIVSQGGKSIAPQKIESLAKTQKMIRELVAFGDNQPYVTALITLDQNRVVEFANTNSILFSEYEELIKNQRVLLWVERALDEINQQLSEFERIRKFIILPEDFTVEGGELTSAQKIRRRVIYERHQSKIEQLYSN